MEACILVACTQRHSRQAPRTLPPRTLHPRYCTEPHLSTAHVTLDQALTKTFWAYCTDIISRRKINVFEGCGQFSHPQRIITCVGSGRGSRLKQRISSRRSLHSSVKRAVKQRMGVRVRGVRSEDASTSRMRVGMIPVWREKKGDEGEEEDDASSD
eukprot:1098775-Pelagomonas_calceolata.AAC.1